MVLGLLVLPVALAPLAGGDGIPGYVIGDVDDPDREFSTIFETRQLARVELVDDSTERISLFLSVFSLDPGENLTIMVPLRTLPVDVTGVAIKESEFREEYSLDRAEREVVRQDPDEAWGLFGSASSEGIETCLGAMLFSLPGEYLRQQVVQEGYYDGKRATDEGGADYAIRGDEGPIQHYEFDGFSIDVFGVGAGPQLEQYLAEKGIVIPEGGGLEDYSDQYVAVIEGDTKPPIDEDDFDDLMEASPATVSHIASALRTDPDRDVEERWQLEYEAEEILWEEIQGDPVWKQEERLLEETLGELVDACFGETDFEGEVIQVDLPLDDGKMFFPLGTSAGWPNQVGDIDVLFQVPEDRELDIEGTEDAFFAGHHWHLFQMEQANPGFDLESALSPADPDRRKEADRAAWMTDHHDVVGPLLAIGVALLLWFGCAAIISMRHEVEGGVLRNRRLWGLFALSLLISIPGALLAYFLYDPRPLREALGQVSTVGPAVMLPLAAVLMLVGGLA